jgi:hypothetical protein
VNRSMGELLQRLTFVFFAKLPNRFSITNYTSANY